MQDFANTQEMGSTNDLVLRTQEDLYTQCRNTFEAFQGLGNVAEDMRILSLNAELAAGRAGTYGVSIRALTQYTRELVNRLEQINTEMAKVEAFAEPEEGAEVAQVQHEQHHEHAETEAYEGYEYGDGYEESYYEESPYQAQLTKFEEDNGGVKYLNEQAKRIAEVVSQSNSIATNMAIEAATAGQYEDTFTNVANDMRGFVNTLKNMVTRAQDSIEKAFRAEKYLKELEATSRNV